MSNKYVEQDDAVQCFFFSSSKQTVNWEQLCETLNSTAESLVNYYIWHKEEFKIIIPLIENDHEFPPHLISTTCFGDNIEDEWFITYIVFKLTEIHRDLIVKIDDNDGDFLLIEAADFLPPWANPETTYNRVFIYKNHVHLIPPSIAPLNVPLKLDNALKLIEDFTEQTRASFQIENAIMKRISSSSYLDKIRELTHRTTVTIPIDLAALLILKPALISSLVNTYCNHDDIDTKVCQKLNLDDCIDISIKFTKFQYAMIMHSKQIICFKQRKFSTGKGEIGFKLACGFKIIMNESNKDKFSSTGFKKFIRSLSTNGYFRDNIEGSKNYNELLDRAKKFYMETECSAISCVYENISQLMSSKEFIHLKETLKQNHHLYLFDDDDDNWLNVDPEQLNDFLKRTYRKQLQSDDLEGPNVVTAGLSNFLSRQSDYEGVEENGNVCIDDNINFNPDEFVQTVENILDMVTRNVSDDDSIEFCSDNDDREDFLATEQLLDEELATKLSLEPNRNSKDNPHILSNLVNSIKEEGISGPTSNILRSIGINKRELLDSDDDSD